MMPRQTDPSISVQTCDVVVIGGGPAGSATAIGLARKGHSVILLDRARFPRDKVCGDYLTPGAVRHLRDEIGILPQIIAAGAVPVTRQRVVAHDGRAFTGSTDALSCPRQVTDALLIADAHSAGVDVREGFSVRDIVFEGDTVIGVRGIDDDGTPFKVTARVTVGADGTHSLLARRLGVVRPIRRLQQIALSAYCGAGPSLPSEGRAGYVRAETSSAPTINCGRGDGFTNALPVTMLGDGGGCEVTMYQPADRSGGCCGFGPACGPDHLSNVNVVVPCSEASAIAGRHCKYFAERLAVAFPAAFERLTDLLDAIQIRSIGCFGHRTRRAAHDGAILVGDAATFIDPFTGEGVYFALEGARLAAGAIDSALRAGNVGYQHLRSYDAARQRVLLPRYRLCDIVQSIVHSPTMLSLGATRLERCPSLADSVLRAVGDVDMPEELVSWENLACLCIPKTQP